ncbi:hypothetical protein CI610_03772 [invertebrate metagenome]|uniref:Uncharacterized protein n=1 Tax=invertebrate metagenome TaxID=1711999 RepID=A0A2H9T269_9ZZZZ
MNVVQEMALDFYSERKYIFTLDLLIVGLGEIHG